MKRFFNMQKIMILQAIVSQTGMSSLPITSFLLRRSRFSGATLYLRIITVVVLVLLLALDLKLVRHRSLLATLNIFVDSVQDTCRSGSTASTGADAAGCDGHEVGQGGLESAALAAAAATELLAGGGSGSRGLFTGLEFEERLLFGWGGVFEKDDAAGGM
jgi:hypothetical protein